MARKRDYIDQACDEWAAVQRETHGLKLPDTFLGPMRCTLAERRDLHHGSRSEKRVQRWPEVHGKDGVCVARAYQHMALALREVLFVHYVVRTATKVKIERLGIGPRLYWERLGRAKSFIDGWLCHDREDESAAA